MNNVADQIARSHFSRKTLSSLKKKNVVVYGITNIPAPSGNLRFANGETGYIVNNDGQSQVLSFMDVLKLAER